jgi:hypothetical protein
VSHYHGRTGGSTGDPYLKPSHRFYVRTTDTTVAELTQPVRWLYFDKPASTWMKYRDYIALARKAHSMYGTAEERIQLERLERSYQHPAYSSGEYPDVRVPVAYISSSWDGARWTRPVLEGATSWTVIDRKDAAVLDDVLAYTYNSQSVKQ